jgi:dTDP-4-dehydrorhamnose 3,5-epimerase
MKVTPTELPEVLLIEPRVFEDPRGFFLETYSTRRYAQAGIAAPFVQDNWSRSGRGTLRGLHFQHPAGQGKLVQVISGSVFDVAVDVRKGSPRFGRWVGVELRAEEKRQLWIPPGFAHGFCVTSDVADFMYKCTELYSPHDEYVVAWNDADLGIQWPAGEPILSARDKAAPRLNQVLTLPQWEEDEGEE